VAQLVQAPAKRKVKTGLDHDVDAEAKAHKVAGERRRVDDAREQPAEGPQHGRRVTKAHHCPEVLVDL
jgi:hypothetical protein